MHTCSGKRSKALRMHTLYHSHMSISIRQIEKLQENYFSYMYTHFSADLFILCPQKIINVSSHDFQKYIVKNIANTQFLLASHYHRTIFTFYMQIIHFLIAKNFSFNQKYNFSLTYASFEYTNMEIALNTFMSGEEGIIVHMRD